MIAQTSFRDTFIFLETFEKGLNIAGYIPFIGSASAWVRDWYSLIEMITGVALVALSLAYHFQGDTTTSHIYVSFAAVFFGHGILNQIRSWIEGVPLWPLVTTLPYDLLATYLLGRRLFSYEAFSL